MCYDFAMIRMSYKDLQIWRKAMDIADAVYSFTEDFPREEMYGLTSQMRRAAISVAANIAEGSQRTTVKDFAHYLLIAKGSLSETETFVLFAERRRLGNDKMRDSLLSNIEELHKMIFAFREKILHAPSHL